ncbi:unnamed protein product [Lymnaea stagnalis]|uniref:Uncharacterized protein n=1 Tax=Lymnaea stagnalis TaxID=6523 RepID=A0AAV2IE75_LYMST
MKQDKVVVFLTSVLPLLAVQTVLCAQVGPSLNDIANIDCPAEQPFKCLPYGACCRGSEFCHSGLCESCFPRDVPESGLLAWCRDTGQHNVSSMRSRACRLACQDRYTSVQLAVIEDSGHTASNLLPPDHRGGNSQDGKENTSTLIPADTVSPALLRSKEEHADTTSQGIVVLNVSVVEIVLLVIALGAILLLIYSNRKPIGQKFSSFRKWISGTRDGDQQPLEIISCDVNSISSSAVTPGSAVDGCFHCGSICCARYVHTANDTPSSVVQTTHDTPSSVVQTTYDTPSNNGQSTIDTPSNNGQSTIDTPSNNGQTANDTPSSVVHTANYTPSSNGQTANDTPSSDVQTANYIPSSNGQTTDYTPSSNGQTTNYTPSSNGQSTNYTPSSNGQTANDTPSSDVQTTNYTPPSNGQSTNYTPSINGQIAINRPSSNGQIAINRPSSNGQIAIDRPSSNAQTVSDTLSCNEQTPKNTTSYDQQKAKNTTSPDQQKVFHNPSYDQQKAKNTKSPDQQAVFHNPSYDQQKAKNTTSPDQQKVFHNPSYDQQKAKNTTSPDQQAVSHTTSLDRHRDRDAQLGDGELLSATENTLNELKEHRLRAEQTGDESSYNSSSDCFKRISHRTIKSATNKATGDPLSLESGRPDDIDVNRLTPPSEHRESSRHLGSRESELTAHSPTNNRSAGADSPASDELPGAEATASAQGRNDPGEINEGTPLLDGEDGEDDINLHQKLQHRKAR